MRDFAMTKTKVLLLLSCLFLVGCRDKSEEKINSTKDSIKSHLPIGTFSAEVESYLKKIECGFIYDKEAGRYTAVLRNVSRKIFATQNMLITIKMDEHDKVKNLDFMVYYENP
jgi:hypothetical protein